MKRLVVSLCLITSMVISGGLVAQTNNTKTKILNENPVPPAKEVTADFPEWTNSFEAFIGVWSLERIVVNDEGVEEKIYPGTFMIVQPNAAYTIVVHSNVGAIITSQGTVIIQSTKEYVEVISRHVNSSLVGISNRIDYKLTPNYLHKSFWIAKDKEGADYNREVKETWKRATMPVLIMDDDSGAYPI